MINQLEKECCVDSAFFDFSAKLHDEEIENLK